MSTPVLEKAKHIKALFLDVDGVLTDGSFWLTPTGDEIKQFHTQDGVGLKALQQRGILVAILSGRSSETVAHRMRELNIQHVYQGLETKLTTYQQLRERLQLQDHQIAYMGDDLPDLPVLAEVGLSIAPANATQAVQTRVDWVTQRSGGAAAVREVCDLILQAQQDAT